MKIETILSGASRLIGKLLATWKGLVIVEAAEDEPPRPKPRVLYVIGEGVYPWYGTMICPCGCGEIIKLSMVKGSRPRWDFSRGWDDAATLSPSVRRQIGCKSHFWVRGGKIVWC